MNENHNSFAGEETASTAAQMPYWNVHFEKDTGGDFLTTSARDESEARSICFKRHGAPGFRVTGVEFAWEHPDNRAPGSRGKRYCGDLFVNGATRVYVANEKRICRILNPRLDLRNHSSTGFAWGYLGSGPAQLSLAILADFLGDDDHALALYQPFKEAFVAGWNQDKEWCLTESVLRTAVDVIARAPHGPYRP